MPLSPGTRLGAYEITGPLGAGGMGEVYRARDTRLDRTVAIKILPELFASDPDRLARFEREAKTLAALNHPNVAQIYGIVELPPEGGSHSVAIAMEFVDGEDLAQRIARGALPIDEAIAVARQIADGLEAAHEQGIVHRDLKPANVKIRPDGAVKVLDFGLAKAGVARTGVARDFSPASGAPQSADSPTFMSPTFTSPAHLRQGSGGAGTEMGIILGTAAYMSPEQARGKAVDKRTDVWAFGCVLYEMLTGRTVFGGETVTDLIAAVLTRDPDWSRLPDDTPLSVRRLLERCLQRDPKRRLRDIGDAAIELDAAAGEAGAVYVVAHRMTWRRVALPAIAILVLVVAASVFAARRLMQPPPPVASHLSIVPPTGVELIAWNNHHTIAISPDGKRVAYLVGTPERLLVRSLDGFENTELPEAVDVRGPTFSPDGLWVLYMGGTGSTGGIHLTKIPVGGGAPSKICPLPAVLRGSSWGPDDTIVFGTGGRTGSGLYRVRASGGAPETLTTPAAGDGEIAHDWPRVLPDGKHVVFRIRRAGAVETSDIGLLSLETRQWSVLVKSASAPRYVSTGHLLYTAGGHLHAVPFDLSSLKTRGDAVPIVEQVVTKTTGSAEFDVSETGTLIYISGQMQDRTAVLVWRDRSGQPTPIGVQRAPYTNGVVSPDQKFIAVTLGVGRTSGDGGLWLVDLQRDSLTRVTPPGVEASNLVWSRDARTIAFWSPNAEGDGKPGGIFQIAASGADRPVRLTEAPADYRHAPSCWSPDGSRLIFSMIPRKAGSGDADLFQLTPGATPGIGPLLAAPGNQSGAVLSPDGRWVAYLSAESGVETQLYVRPYPNVNEGRTLISPGLAIGATWRGDGRELIFADAGQIYAVPVNPSHDFAVGKPVPLMRFESGSGILDITPDGQRSLWATARTDSVDAKEIRVVLNWFEELKGKSR